MNSPENQLGSSRHEHRHRRRLSFNYDQHTTLTKEVIYLADILEKSTLTPNATVSAREGIPISHDGRTMSVTSSKHGDKIEGLDIHIYGGLDNQDSIRYEYQPALSAYFKTINYSHTTHVVDPIETVETIGRIPQLELPPLDDSLTVSPEAIDAAVASFADLHPGGNHTLSKRYEYHDLEDLNADLIIHDINNHTRHYVFDVYTHVKKDGHNLLVAGTYQFEVDSTGRPPVGRASIEIVTKTIVTKEQKQRYLAISPEESLLYLVSAVKRIHTSTKSDDIAS